MVSQPCLVCSPHSNQPYCALDALDGDVRRSEMNKQSLRAVKAAASFQHYLKCAEHRIRYNFQKRKNDKIEKLKQSIQSLLLGNIENVHFSFFHTLFLMVCLISAKFKRNIYIYTHIHRQSGKSRFTVVHMEIIQ